MAGQGSNLVTVRCDDHHERLVSGLYKFLLSSHGIDFDVRWGERTVWTHRLILDLFLSPDKLAETAADQYGSSPYAFLEFLYTGTVTIPEEQLENLMEVARKSNFTMLVDALEQCRLPGKSDRTPGNGPDLYGDLTTSAAAMCYVTLEEGQKNVSDGKSVKKGSKKKDSFGFPNEIELSMDVEGEDENSNTLDETWEDSCISSGDDHVTSNSGTTSVTRVRQKMTKSDLCSINKQKRLDSKKDHSDSSSAQSFSKSNLLTSSDSWLTCPDCNYKTHQEKRMVDHRSSHCNPKPPAKSGKVKTKPKSGTKKTSTKTGVAKQTYKSYQCPHCPYKTFKKHLHEVHQATHDSSIKVFKCQWCSKRMVDSTKLARHKCIRLGGANLHHCPHCDYKNRNLGPFQVHVARHDPNAIIHRCKACGKPFANEEVLSRHHCKLSEPGAKPLQCPYCPFTNKFGNQMRYHIKGMHSATKPYKCEQPGCNYAASLKTNLRIHVQIAHLDHKPFVCEKCAYRTHHQSLLIKHQRVHSDECIFKCDECERTFRNSRTLKEHKGRHAGLEKSHVCHVCGSAFYRRDTLRNHLKNVHKNALAAASTST